MQRVGSRYHFRNDNRTRALFFKCVFFVHSFVHCERDWTAATPARGVDTSGVFNFNFFSYARPIREHTKEFFYFFVCSRVNLRCRNRHRDFRRPDLFWKMLDCARALWGDGFVKMPRVSIIMQNGPRDCIIYVVIYPIYLFCLNTFIRPPTHEGPPAPRVRNNIV